MKLFNKIIGGATKITKHFTPKSQLTPITDRLYHCPYPTEPAQLHSEIKRLNPQNISICNLSEYPYSANLRQKLEELGFEISEPTYQFYSSMPLTTAITEINKIQAFLRSSDRNFVLVHCQENRSRSVLFLSAYLYLSGKVTDIATALATVNESLGISSNETVYSSQHAILRNIANYHKDSSFINREELKLVKLIINQAPKLSGIELTEEQPLMVLMQIRRNGVVVYKKMTKQFGQGEIVQFNMRDDNIYLADDCLFSFKYVYREKIYPVMRIQLNTNFIFNCFVRVPQHEIDFCKNLTMRGHVFTDFLFLAMKGRESQLSKLEGNLQIQPVAAKQNEKEIKTKNNKQVEQSTSQKQRERDGNVFNIDDDGRDREEFDEQLAEEKLNKLLISMAMKKAEVEEDIKQAQQEDQKQQEKEEQKQKPKQAEESVKDISQSSVEYKKSEPQPLEEQEKEQKPLEQQKKPSIQQKNDQRQTQKAKQQSKVQEQQELDIDEYLSKLQQQAEQN